MSKQIIMTMNEEQAGIVNRACEFYARVLLGQFQEITFELMLMQPLDDTFCDRRDCADELLLKARQYIYPDLGGCGHSYGLGKFDTADIAYNCHQVLRHALGDERKPYDLYNNGMPTVEVTTKEEKKK